MTEETRESYDSGEVVWVKLGTSWWPGEVKNAEELPSDVLDFKKPPLVIVKFFDEDSYEYVKTWANIYPYDCDKKNEFIKKGMAAYRAKVPHMEKFPKDVLKAEETIGGNPNILSNPMFLPEKKRNYAAEIFGTPSPKNTTPKNKKRSSANKSGKKDTSHITHRRFLGVDDYRAYICIQYPGKDRIPGDKEDDEVIRINREPEQDFNCHSCSFSTKRLEVMILHTKSHIQGVYLASTRKNKQTVRRRKEKAKKPKGSDVVDSDTSTSDSEPVRQKKRKPKSQGTKKTKIKKTEEELPKKDIRSELLEAWEDSDDEDLDFSLDKTNESESVVEKTDKIEDIASTTDLTIDDSLKKSENVETLDQSDSTMTETADETSSRAKLVVDETKSPSQTIEEALNDVSGEPDDSMAEIEPIKPVEEEHLSTEKLLSTLEDDSTDVDDKGEKTEKKTEENDKIVEENDKKDEEIDANAQKSDSDEEISKQKMDKDIHEAIKSCFDFDEDEEEDNSIVGKASTGRKIPRVIPKVPRKKSSETVETHGESKEQDEDMSAAFKELMEITSVPDLPDVQNSLKCEQNFHNIKTIKFPDKPESPPKLERKDSTEVATKLTNPKKRFVKSFEDFELMQNEIRRKEEESSKTETEVEVGPSYLDNSDEQDSPESNIQLSKLKSKIMSKIIEEAKINAESKNRIMSKMQEPKIEPNTNSLDKSKVKKTFAGHRTPRSKILESYRIDTSKPKDEEKSVLPKTDGPPEETVQDRLRVNQIEKDPAPPKKSRWSRRGSHPKKDKNLFLFQQVTPEAPPIDETVKETTEEPIKSEDKTSVEPESTEQAPKIKDIVLDEPPLTPPVPPTEVLEEEEIEMTVKEPETVESQPTDLASLQVDENDSSVDKNEEIEETHVSVDKEVLLEDIPLPSDSPRVETKETHQENELSIDTEEVEAPRHQPIEITEETPQPIEDTLQKLKEEETPVKEEETPIKEEKPVKGEEEITVDEEIVDSQPKDPLPSSRAEEPSVSSPNTFNVPSNEPETVDNYRSLPELIPIAEQHVEVDDSLMLSPIADASPNLPQDAIITPPKKSKKRKISGEDSVPSPNKAKEETRLESEEFAPLEKRIKEGEEVKEISQLMKIFDSDVKVDSEITLENEPSRDEPKGEQCDTNEEETSNRARSEEIEAKGREEWGPESKENVESEKMDEEIKLDNEITSDVPQMDATNKESEEKVEEQGVEFQVDESKPKPVEVDEESIEVSKEPVEVDKEPIEIRKEPVEVSKEPVEISKESVEVDKEPVEVSKELVEVDKELVEVSEEPVVVEKESVEISEEPIEIDKELVEVDKESVKIDTESIEIKESVKFDKESVEINESVRVDKESVEINKESVHIDKESVQIDKESVEVDKESVDENDHKNEVEIQCASSSVDSFKFSIQTNLSILSSREEMSALALATLSEIKADLESNEDVLSKEEKEDKPERILPPVLLESEMVPIEGNLTVVSEKDLADGQVEITSDQVISPKRPVTLSNFSMDFSDSLSDSNSNSTTDTSCDLGKCDFNSKGTEFTAKALTKQMKRLDHKKESTYGRLELINILEGNSDTEKKPKEYTHPPKKTSMVDDICDFEEHIPSQIVCAKNLKKDAVDLEQDFKEFKEKEKPSKTSVKSTTSKLLERLTTESKAKASAAKLASDAHLSDTIGKLAQNVTPKHSKYTPKSKLGIGTSKPIILSEQIVKAATETSKTKPRKAMEDIEDVEAFVIHKDLNKVNFEEEETVKSKTSSTKTAGKAKILQQTIITPAGEIIQPNVTDVQTDDNIFDINSMPIVLSDEILTPESIEKMPIVIGSDTKVTVAEKVVKRPAPSRIITTTATPNKTITITKHKPPRILQTFSNRVVKNSPLLPNTAKPGKYIIVPQSSIPPTKYLAKKPAIVKKTAVSAGVVQKVPSIAPEPSGNKIMIVTNQQGQQQRLLLTPAQQKMLGYQNQKVTKTIVKGNVMQKSVLAKGEASTSGVISKTPTIIGQKVVVSASATQGLITTTSHQVIGIQGRTTKTVTKRTPAAQKLGTTAGKPQKTILIKNQHGQTVRKIQGTDDELLDKQVAEQLKAIKASSGMKFSSQKPQEPEKVTPKTSVRRSYSKRVEVKPRGPPPLSGLQPSPKQETVVSMPTVTAKKPEPVEAKPTAEEAKTQQPDRPLNQLVIQDAVGNQTTITEGQILALPSETVDGQPQSYMLVTLDESGNLTPLNSEALMSLDPNLGLGGDLSNMVLQFDHGGLNEQSQAAIIKPPEVPEPVKAVEVEPVVPVPEPSVTTEITESVPEQKIVPVTETVPQVTPSTNGDPGQQLIVTGDPIATQKFLESLTEGTTDLANILANAEGNSILIQADGQQILINTNTDNQMLLSMNNDNVNVTENTEGGGNPIFSTQPSKNQDILAAALADTDVFQQEHPSSTQRKIGSQLSPNNTLYPMNVGNVLETSLTLSSPIMTPLEVPSTNSKKIPDDEADILTQVPKNVDLPITITDPNISQTVANQQVSQMIANELQTNLELALPISETTISTVSTEMNSPSYSYSLPALEDSVEMTQKPFNGSMPLLNEDVEETMNKKALEGEDGEVERKSATEDSQKEKAKTELSFLGEEEGRFTLGGEMCSSLSEPPPEMFDLPEVNQNFSEKSAASIPSLQSTPDVSDNASKDEDTTDLSQADTSSEGSCEIPLQPQIVTKSLDLSRNLDSLKRSLSEAEGENKKCKFD